MSLSVVAPLAERVGRETGLHPWHLLAHADKESGLNPKAVSRPGASGLRAYGLLQLQPPTFKAMLPQGNILDPLDNLRAGATYYVQLRNRFGAPELALAAYNWGPAKVARLMKRLGPTWEAIKAKVPFSVRWYVWRISQLALKYQHLWR